MRSTSFALCAAAWLVACSQGSSGPVIAPPSSLPPAASGVPDAAPAPGADSGASQPDAPAAAPPDDAQLPVPTPDDAGDDGGDNGAVPIDGAAGGGLDADGPTACPALVAGWTSDTPTVTIQFEDNGTIAAEAMSGSSLHDAFCSYEHTGDIELFKMLKNPANGIQRCEARVNNDYRTGSNQFEGDVRVTAGNATCVHQIFKFVMLDAFPQNGGELHEHTGALIVSGVFDRWVHVNSIHHVAAGSADIYIDCVKRMTVPSKPPDSPNGWYNKYGLYAVLGQPPREPVASVEWRNVRYYRQ